MLKRGEILCVPKKVLVISANSIEPVFHQYMWNRIHVHLYFIQIKNHKLIQMLPSQTLHTNEPNVSTHSSLSPHVFLTGSSHSFISVNMYQQLYSSFLPYKPLLVQSKIIDGRVHCIHLIYFSPMITLTDNHFIQLIKQLQHMIRTTIYNYNL